MQRRGKNMAKLKAVITMLLEGAPLDPSLRDHPLKGEWAGWRDLPIEPDWLLLYRASESEVFLPRTGTHSDVFGE